MLSLYNIWNIARYEVKTLLRSWFFRIFSAITLLILGFFSVIFFTRAVEQIPWQFRALPASIPYFNMMLLNLAQAVIAIFLASDFLKRDRKSDTTEVIYMRSMSNADYIFGKSIGLLTVFLGLDILLLSVAALINVIFSDVPFQPIPYIAYLGLMSLPTLIFMFGLSFLIMSLVRNQAITIILLLGYFAVSLIVLNVKHAALFDNVAFFLPFAYSDFVGFGDWSLLLQQRLLYFCLGLGFIFVSVLLFKRLPQSRAMQGLSRILAVLFLVSGIYLGYSYLKHIRSGEILRAKMIELNDTFADKPVVSVNDYSISLKHQNDRIQVTTTMNVLNSNPEPLSELIFSLNPGLLVETLSIDANQRDYIRDIHLVRINLDTPLSSEESLNVTMQYSGRINDDACYPAVDEEERNKLYSVALYKIGKHHSFISSDYVLLTSEATWYPIPGVTHGTPLLNYRQTRFSNYYLEVETGDQLTAVSQGKVTKKQDTFVFDYHQPLPQISLVIGPYLKRHITVDSVAYNLYTHHKHEYFIPYTEQVSDTLEPLIRELKNDYELKTKIDYPYDYFTLIEVPTQFVAYAVPLVFHRDYVQPMQVFLPENGALINSADFHGNVTRMLDRVEDRNQTMSEKEVQYQTLRRFFETELLGTGGMRRFGPPTQQEEGVFTIFPNFYRFVNTFSSADLPIFDKALESYLKIRVESSNSGFMRFRQAVTDEEKASLKLHDASLKFLLQDPEQNEIANDLLSLKSTYLFRLMESRIGQEELERFTSDILSDRRFKPTAADHFINAFEQKYNLSLRDELDVWYNQNTVPGYYITDVKNYKVIDQERQRYQVIFTLYNTEPVEGVVVVDFLIQGRGGFGRLFGGGSSSDYQRAIHVPGETAKQIAILTDDQPRGLTLNTLASLNLPSQTIRRFEDFEDNKKAKPIEGETILDFPPNLSIPGEIIVDNEDEGFKVLTEENISPLKKLFQKDDQDKEEYVPLTFWRAPEHWSKTINSMFYGDFVHSAHYIRGGDGSSRVAWEAQLETPGQYAVYSYHEDVPMRGGPGRGRGRERESFIKDYHFYIYHDDGIEDVEWNSESAEGWNFLGTYYFSKGTAKVEMSNQSEGRFIFADAIKWIKK